MKIFRTHEILTPADLPKAATEQDFIYNGLDACTAHELDYLLTDQFDNTTRAVYEFERALIGPVLKMNMTGILIDEVKRQELITTYQFELAHTEDTFLRIIREGFGLNINWRSNQQLMNLFYNVMKIPPFKKRNAQGFFVPTINREAIEQLDNYFDTEFLGRQLLYMRDRDKLISKLKSEVDSDGRIRATSNIGGTTTGRFNSTFNDFGTGTNLQNIDGRLKRIFIADPGKKLCNIDLAQSDSRAVGAIIWNLFGDGKYLDACESGDLHTTVARMTWPNKDPRENFYRKFTYRDAAKREGHATNFMGTAEEISKQVRIPIHFVKEFQALYLAQFPMIPRWWEERKQRLLTDGQLTSLLGMKRYFWGRRNDPRTLKKMIAFEPQNTTGYTINRGLLNIAQHHTAFPIEILLQVHDSLLLQFPEGLENLFVPWIISQVEQTITLKNGREFTIPAEATVGWNYSHYNEDNPDGLKGFNGNDTRARTFTPTTIMGDPIRRVYGEHRVPIIVPPMGSDLNDSSEP